MSQYKYLVVSDLDGTLLDSQGNLSKETIEFVKALNSRDDVLFTFSTGRDWPNAKEIYEALQLKGFVSCANGSHIYNPHNGVQIYSYLEESLVVSILESEQLFDGYSRGLILAVGETIEYDKTADRKALIAKIREKKLHVYYMKVWFDGKEFPKHDGKINEKIKFLKDLKHAPEVVAYDSSVYGNWDFEIQAERTSKNKFIKFASVYYGVPKSHIVSFGDQINDLPMALGGSWFIAVRNGIFYLKTRANQISQWTNDENAVIKETEKFLEKWRGS